MLLFFSLLSVLAGVTVVLGRILNANLAQKIGTVQATTINYVVGLFFSFLLFIVINQGFQFSSSYAPLPIWAYCGGLLGIVIIMASNHITHHVPTFYLTLLVFLGQLSVGFIIDWLISKEFSTSKLIGSLLVVTGFTYNLILDKKSAIKQE